MLDQLRQQLVHLGPFESISLRTLATKAGTNPGSGRFKSAIEQLVEDDHISFTSSGYSVVRNNYSIVELRKFFAVLGASRAKQHIQCVSSAQESVLRIPLNQAGTEELCFRLSPSQALRLSDELAKSGVDKIIHPDISNDRSSIFL